jgi:hypothetical protein
MFKKTYVAIALGLACSSGAVSAHAGGLTSSSTGAPALEANRSAPSIRGDALPQEVAAAPMQNEDQNAASSAGDDAGGRVENTAPGDRGMEGPPGVDRPETLERGTLGERPERVESAPQPERPQRIETPPPPPRM